MRNVLKQLKQYKRQTFLCIGLTALEVIMEILMPFVTAFIIDRGLEAGNLPVVYGLGAVMVVMAFLGLIFGALAGRNAAGAAAGLSANLREAIYSNIQTFSFSKIDKFSVPGLVTRMTTDITNVQNAFMMIIRVAVRAPLNFIFSFIMCLLISPRLGSMFLIAVVFLIAVIGTIMVVTLKIFKQVFRRHWWTIISRPCWPMAPMISAAWHRICSVWPASWQWASSPRFPITGSWSMSARGPCAA